MGRWSQRRHCGSAEATAPTGTYITAALIVSTSDVTVTYSADLDVSLFDPDAFITLPSGSHSIGIAQDASNSGTATFGADISGDTLLVYTGTTPGIQTPQIISLTP